MSDTGRTQANEPASIADGCIVHTWESDVELFEYLPAGWQEYVLAHVAEPWQLHFRGDAPRPVGNIGGPMATVTPFVRAGGDSEGYSSVEAVTEEHLDRHGIDMGLLCSHAASRFPVVGTVQLSLALTRALNEWTCERWLRADGRFVGTIAVPTQVPELAADEIRSFSSRDGMEAVLLAANGLGRPFGHPAYEPILRAASECDMLVAIMAGGDAMVEAPAHPAAAGVPATYGEFRALAPQALMTHATSLICQGVVERYPNLRFLLLGGGVGWVVPFLWRLDDNARAFRHDIAWMKKEASEYFWDHFKVGTAPSFLHAATGDIASYLEVEPRLQQAVCYASALPEPEPTTPHAIAEFFPDAWRTDVLSTNLRSIIGLGGREHVRNGADV
jgi:uncharacterized protein